MDSERLLIWRKQCTPSVIVVVEEYLEGSILEQMECLADFPNLNPIRRLWEKLGRQVVA